MNSPELRSAVSVGSPIMIPLVQTIPLPILPQDLGARCSASLWISGRLFSTFVFCDSGWWLVLTIAHSAVLFSIIRFVSRHGLMYFQIASKITKWPKLCLNFWPLCFYLCCYRMQHHIWCCRKACYICLCCICLCNVLHLFMLHSFNNVKMCCFACLMHLIGLIKT